MHHGTQEFSAFLFFLSFFSISMGGHLSSTTTSISDQKTSTSYVRLLCTTLHVLVVVGGDELGKEAGKQPWRA
jgi:hypothetical protein